MSLHVDKNQPNPETAILSLAGRLTMGPECRQLDSTITDLTQNGVKHVIIDLSRLDGIDSTGAGILVVCHSKLHKVHGSLRIAGAQGIVHETLLMIHVDRLVPFFPTAVEATQNVPAS
jgi:anti-sigma B factor antagonist